MPAEARVPKPSIIEAWTTIGATDSVPTDLPRDTWLWSERAAADANARDGGHQLIRLTLLVLHMTKDASPAGPMPAPVGERETPSVAIPTSKPHNCWENAVPYEGDGPLGHGWECGRCGAFLQAG